MQYVSPTAYHLVIVVELYNDIWRTAGYVLRVSVNLYIIENQSLVPGRVQRRSELLRCLAKVQEGDVCIRI